MPRLNDIQQVIRTLAPHVFLAGAPIPRVASGLGQVLLIEAHEAQDPETLLRFLASGGGVLVLSDDRRAPHATTSQVLAAAGLALTSNVLRTPAAEAPYIASPVIVCDGCVPIGRPALIQIQVHGARAIGCSRATTQPWAWTSNAETVLASATLGTGRIIVVGDGDMFRACHIGETVNGVCLLSAVHWLAHLPLDPEDTAHALKILTLASPLPLQLVAESPVAVDCTPYMDRLLELSGRAPRLREGLDAFLFETSSLSDELPSEIRRLLRTFSLSSTTDGVALFDNLPVEAALPPTPVDGQPVQRSTDLAEFCMAATGGRLGDFVGYIQEREGAVFQDLTPARAKEFDQVSESSRKELFLHTESVFHPHIPDFVALFCLRSDHEGRAATTFAGIRRALAMIPPKTRAILFQRVFRTGIDQSFGNTSRQKGNGPLLSVLWGDPEDPYLRYDLDLMVGTSPEASEALTVLHRALVSVTRGVVLRPGSLLIIDNKRAVHGRTSFIPRYDGRDRWLVRTSIVRDLSRSNGSRIPNSRMICTEFVA